MTKGERAVWSSVYAYTYCALALPGGSGSEAAPNAAVTAGWAVLGMRECRDAVVKICGKRDRVVDMLDEMTRD